MSTISIHLTPDNKLRLTTGEKQASKRKTALFECRTDKNCRPDWENPFPDEMRAFLLDNGLTSFGGVLVLPNYCVTMDTVTVPTFGKHKMMEAVKAEFRKLYRNHVDFETTAILLNSDKTKTTVLFALMRTEIVVALKKALTRMKIVNPIVTFEANSLSNAVFALRPALRKTDNMLVLPLKGRSVVSFTRKQSTVGLAEFPLGADAAGKQIHPFSLRYFPSEDFDPRNADCLQTAITTPPPAHNNAAIDETVDGAQLLGERLADCLGFFRKKTDCSPEKITLLREISFFGENSLFKTIIAEDGETEFADLIAFGAFNAANFNKELNF